MSGLPSAVLSANGWLGRGRPVTFPSHPAAARDRRGGAAPLTHLIGTEVESLGLAPVRLLHDHVTKVTKRSRSPYPAGRFAGSAPDARRGATR